MEALFGMLIILGIMAVMLAGYYLGNALDDMGYIMTSPTTRMTHDEIMKHGYHSGYNDALKFLQKKYAVEHHELMDQLAHFVAQYDHNIKIEATDHGGRDLMTGEKIFRAEMKIYPRHQQVMVQKRFDDDKRETFESFYAENKHQMDLSWIGGI